MSSLIRSEWKPGEALLDIPFNWESNDLFAHPKFIELVVSLEHDFDFIRQAKESRRMDPAAPVDFKRLSDVYQRILGDLRSHIYYANEHLDAEIWSTTVVEMDRLCTIYTELAGDVRDETDCPDHYPLLRYWEIQAYLHESVWACSSNGDQRELTKRHKESAEDCYKLAYKGATHPNHPPNDPTRISVSYYFAVFLWKKEEYQQSTEIVSDCLSSLSGTLDQLDETSLKKIEAMKKLKEDLAAQGHQ